MKTRLAIACTLALAPCAAWAGPVLSTEEPQMHSTVRAAPNEARLEFHEAIDPAGSAMTVKDSKGRSVALDTSHVSPDEKEMLTIGLKQLPAGTYTVRWHATNARSHETSHGQYDFTISP